MIGNILTKVFGSRNERLVKRMQRRVEAINAMESDLQQLSDEALQAKTQAFRERLEAGETLDDLLEEAFAVVREAARRVLGMRHYDVQLIGGMVLHQGKIAEMATGEGKTLVATLPMYLNALAGEGAHLVTVNDYLAQRDADWMGRIYRFLGLTVGVVIPGMDSRAKRDAYGCDITYGTNNEFGFDYLRDNMAFSRDEQVQRGHAFAIVDEVDSILIDEARTPLIISGPARDNAELYHQINGLVPELEKQEVEEPAEGEELAEEDIGDFTIDEKQKQVYLTERGHQRVEDLLEQTGLLDEQASLYDPSNIAVLHHLNAALRAHTLYHRDVDYIVRDNQIVIVDEFTGRTMPGRRWSEGLHQAIEAKEGVPIQKENQTLASITFQNYFRLYDKLAGMTGTADTEATEFQQIYGLEVVSIPTHRPSQRTDHGDLIYLTQAEKYDAIVADIRERHEKGQPVLVGTASIEVSEVLAKKLKENGIKHFVLNAKQHEKEAEIIAQAGRPGAVTIATNMAGRGTDIVLGGNVDAEIMNLKTPDEETKTQLRSEWEKRHQRVLEAGGLHVIGTERHESRRVDNQLRGRSGRQGDPGSTRFFVSLEDSLMRIFASQKVSGLMKKLGMQEGEAIEHPWVSRAIENAQRKVEGHNFDMRKHLLEYDDVANDQRSVIYRQREDLLEKEDVSDVVANIRRDVVNQIIDRYIAPGSIDEQWDVPGLEKALAAELGVEAPVGRWLDEDEQLHEEPLREKILEAVEADYAEKEALAGPEAMRRLEKAVMLQVLDTQWKDHLAAMDYLRQSIGLRGYANKNPMQEYKKEAFAMFSALLENIKEEVVKLLSRVEIQAPEKVDELETPRTAPEQMEARHESAQSALAAEEAGETGDDEAGTFVREGRKMGRNEPCWCGSGKKYKHCHGKLS